MSVRFTSILYPFYATVSNFFIFFIASHGRIGSTGLFTSEILRAKEVGFTERDISSVA
jgi:hypothetical protein